MWRVRGREDQNRIGRQVLRAQRRWEWDTRRNKRRRDERQRKGEKLEKKERSGVRRWGLRSLQGTQEGERCRRRIMKRKRNTKKRLGNQNAFHVRLNLRKDTQRHDKFYVCMGEKLEKKERSGVRRWGIRSPRGRQGRERCRRQIVKRKWNKKKSR